MLDNGLLRQIFLNVNKLREWEMNAIWRMIEMVNL